MLILGVYASYYYSNYKVQNLPVRATFPEMPNTRLIDDLDKKPAKEANLVYAPLSPEYAQSPFLPTISGYKMPDTTFTNNNLVIRTGQYNDSTMGYIRRMEAKNFEDNYQHTTGFTKNSPFIFTHYRLEQVFRNNFRYYQKYLPFGEARVKAVTNIPGKPSPDRYRVYHYRMDTLFRQLVVIKRSAGNYITFAIPKVNQSLKVLYQSAERLIQEKRGDTLEKNDQLVLPLMDFQLRNTYARRDSSSAGEAVQGYTKFTTIMNTQYNVLKKPGSGQSAAHRMVFNKPFLFYHKHPMITKSPSFLAWIGNGRLLLDKNRNSERRSSAGMSP
jgi:hypothetical protein